MEKHRKSKEIKKQKNWIFFGSIIFSITKFLNKKNQKLPFKHKNLGHLELFSRIQYMKNGK